MSNEYKADTNANSTLSQVLEGDFVSDLSNLGVIEAAGNDAEKLLQGQLTCDVPLIREGTPQLAAHCNPQGRVMSLFHVLKHQGNYYLLLPVSMVELVLADLGKYAVFFNVTLSDVSSQWRCLGVHERGARTLIMEPTSKPSMVACVSHTVWQYADIIAGIPSIFPETRGLFVPQRLNLDLLGAISFEKGCYIGQEIIARLHYRGKQKHHLYCAIIYNIVTFLPGEAVLNETGDKQLGTVVASCANGSQTVLLVVLPDADAKEKHVFYQQQVLEFLKPHEK